MESSRIPSVPPSMFYIPNFITPEEEATILSKIPPTRWIALSHRRLQAHPAKLTSTNTLVSSTSLPSWLTDPVVPRITSIVNNKENDDSRNLWFTNAPHGINHCLINEYLPGQGIMPHEDGAAYWPVVATVSLGGSVVLDITAKSTTRTEDNQEETDHANGSSRSTWRILQEPRSLLLTTGDAYTETLHGIAEVEEDVGLSRETVANWDLLSQEGRETVKVNGGKNVRTTRISLTFRDVKKVADVGSKIFGRPRGMK